MRRCEIPRKERRSQARQTNVPQNCQNDKHRFLSLFGTRAWSRMFQVSTRGVGRVVPMLAGLCCWTVRTNHTALIDVGAQVDRCGAVLGRSAQPFALNSRPACFRPMAS